MAGASLFALLDDIAALLDDVSILTKVAAKKTAGVLGDDLALNAQQVTGVNANRELPVVWAVAKGSLVNKAILVPAALAISAWLPWAITPLMMIGGAFLCYEGVEKLAHKFLHRQEEAQHHAALVQAVDNPAVDLLAFEQDKIKGAIRTDFILSAEIIIIALGVVGAYSILTKSLVMSAIGLGMTVLVYGLVAGIVKMDDIGFWLMSKPNAAARALGRGIIAFMPWFMRGLSVVGTLAMFLVGGGIIAHNAGWIHEFLHAHHWDSGLAGQVANLIIGVITGALVCAVVLPLRKLLRKKAAH